MLSFPPHCSHKLQPLDRSVSGPLKTFFNSACDGWMKSNPGKTICIYDIPGLVKDVFPKAATPSNIMAGFKVTGVYPFNKDIFTEIDFMPSYVTDRPVPVAATSATPAAVTEAEVDEEINPSIEIPDITIAQSAINYGASTSKAPPAVIPANKPNVSISPHEVRPFPKAEPRKVSNRGRKKRSSAILTDTPVKKKLEEEKSNAAAKKGNIKKRLYYAQSHVKLSQSNPKKIKVEPSEKKQPGKKTSRPTPIDSSEDESCICLVCGDAYTQYRRL